MGPLASGATVCATSRQRIEAVEFGLHSVADKRGRVFLSIRVTGSTPYSSR